MEKIGIFYGSTTGNSETVANKLQENFGSECADIIDVSNASSADIERYTNLIFGCSTWGIGDLQDDFEGFISEIEKSNLEGKKIAIYGTGDQFTYSDSFVDSIGSIYEAIENKSCQIVGSVSTDDYSYTESKAEIDGQFVGLPIDEDNDSEKTDSRIQSWTEILKGSFN